MSEANKALVRRNFEEIWNRENYALVDELHAPDYVAHIASTPAVVRGREQFKQFVALRRFAFPDTRFVVEDQLAEGDKVATRWTAHGTHQRAFMGVAPSGRALTITGISIHRIVNGQIVESWDNWDALSLLPDLGEDVLDSLSLQL
jgi:steroid delta-isomerase-like uncharacterized protein